MKKKVKHMPDYQVPKRIEIELASACNLKCTYCPRHFVDDLKGFIDFSLYKRLIDEISDDLKFYGSTGSPTIKIKEMAISGE